MTTFTVSSDFPVGTTGTVVFRRKEWLTSVAEGLIPPADVTATLSGSPPGIDQVLRASEESGVSPDFDWEVFVRLDGHTEMRGILHLTANCDLATAIQFTTPSNPDLFVTRAEYEADQEAAGNPASQGALDAEEAAREAADDALDARLDTAEADIDALQAADTALDARLDAEEAATTAYDARLDALEAADTALDGRLDTEEAATIAHDGRLDDIEDGTAIGRIINTDDEGTTIFIGATSPTGQVTGDIWLDPTP